VFIAPALLGFLVFLLWPTLRGVYLSFTRFNLLTPAEWIGLDNYSTIIHDHTFWVVLARTFAFTAVNVSLTMILGTLIALLLTRLARPVRVLLTTGLVLVWAMPVVVAVQVWAWMVDFEFGVANWALTELHVGNFNHHDWFANPISGFGVITALIVWGAIPFVTITVYAGLSQLPRDLVEAASIDGANPWRVFLDITLPILKPIFLILTSLSIIWDFGVFTQPYLLIGSAHVDSSNYLMGVYVYIEGYAHSDFGRGAAISMLMLLIVAALSVVYVRGKVRMEEIT